jgi:threonine/homoserine/homoserine lactone efflux protein
MLENTKEIASLFGVVAALTMGVVSPGPSFVMVARTAVASSRSQGLAAALGMGAGGALFATAALLGLKGVLLAVPSIYIALKVAGGLYLAYLGIQIWRAARQPLRIDAVAAAAAPSRLGGFLRGLTTQVSNPKTAIVYASVFAAFLPPAPSLGFDVALVIMVSAVESGWYGVVALALSSSGPRAAYLRYKAWIDRTAGAVMVALGLKLVSSVRA